MINAPVSMSFDKCIRSNSVAPYSFLKLKSSQSFCNLVQDINRKKVDPSRCGFSGRQRRARYDRYDTYRLCTNWKLSSLIKNLEAEIFYGRGLF